jgi:antitoxin (DNA-binding transcriptional repressor) of toxin-antitoxin stability system
MIALFPVPWLTSCHDLCHDYFMASVNIRQLRDTRRLKAWLRAGKTVELRERERVIARIVPAGRPNAPDEWPDFAARRRRIFGDRIMPGADLVILERGRY